MLPVSLARVVLRKMEEYLQYLPSPQPRLQVGLLNCTSQVSSEHIYCTQPVKCVISIMYASTLS
jgi:hypothetical protein